MPKDSLNLQKQKKDKKSTAHFQKTVLSQEIHCLLLKGDTK